MPPLFNEKVYINYASVQIEGTVRGTYLHPNGEQWLVIFDGQNQLHVRKVSDFPTETKTIVLAKGGDH